MVLKQVNKHLSDNKEHVHMEGNNVIITYRDPHAIEYTRKEESLPLEKENGEWYRTNNDCTNVLSHCSLLTADHTAAAAAAASHACIISGTNCVAYINYHRSCVRRGM